MNMWPEFTEAQTKCQQIAYDLLSKRDNDPRTWEDVERLIRKGYIERSRQRRGGVLDEQSEEIVNEIVNLIFEEEIHLIWPIIRRFFQQR